MTVNDDRALRKLAAAAEYERRVLDLAAQACSNATEKVARSESAVDAARDAQAEAEGAVEAARVRAEAAEAAYREAADGQSVIIGAQAATAAGKAT